MVLDGAGWPRANDLVIPERIRLLPQPVYSSELNPLEHRGEEIREKWFPHLVFDSLDAVEDRLEAALAALERGPNRVASTTAFDWIIPISLNANEYETYEQVSGLLSGSLVARVPKTVHAHGPSEGRQ